MQIKIKWLQRNFQTFYYYHYLKIKKLILFLFQKFIMIWFLPLYFQLIFQIQFPNFLKLLIRMYVQCFFSKQEFIKVFNFNFESRFSRHPLKLLNTRRGCLYTPLDFLLNKQKISFLSLLLLDFRKCLQCQFFLFQYPHFLIFFLYQDPFPHLF